MFRGYLHNHFMASNKPKKRRNQNDGLIHYEDEWTLHHDKGIEVAVKRIQLAQIKSRASEEMALRQLDHLNVMKLLHIESDEHFRLNASCRECSM